MRDTGGFGGAGASARWQEVTVLTVTREPIGLDPDAPTIGRMTASGLAVPIWTLEDPWRDNAPRVSCIPEGTYRLLLLPSPRFHRSMLRLLNVPGRTGILIHGGNDADDTEGCILVGRELTEDRRALMRSQEALSHVTGWTLRALRVGDVYCRIARQPLAAEPPAPLAATG